jgi:dihydroorotate dehydrogenase (NAD+) catalytic subunit
MVNKDMPNLQVKIGRLNLKNPVMVASGTFGYAEEFEGFMDLKKLGAIVTKTITLKPRKGNPMPRTCETPSGMLNSIGLENPGIDVFIKDKMLLLKKAGVPVIVSIASETNPSEFVRLARRLDTLKEVAAIELNISCPNLENKKLISQDPQATYGVIQAVRKATSKTIITKLSPNVTDITEIARAAESAGSDALSLVNTLIGMSVDIDARRPKLAVVTGGLSGPAIRPVAVRMVWEVARAVNIPVIGIGGIMTAHDALEFIIAGATAVQVGTANFTNPRIAEDIIEGLTKYLKDNKITDIKNIMGALIT